MLGHTSCRSSRIMNNSRHNRRSSNAQAGSPPVYQNTAFIHHESATFGHKNQKSFEQKNVPSEFVRRVNGHQQPTSSTIFRYLDFLPAAAAAAPGSASAAAVFGTLGLAPVLLEISHWWKHETRAHDASRIDVQGGFQVRKLHLCCCIHTGQ